MTACITVFCINANLFNGIKYLLDILWKFVHFFSAWDRESIILLIYIILRVELILMFVAVLFTVIAFVKVQHNIPSTKHAQNNMF